MYIIDFCYENRTTRHQHKLCINWWSEIHTVLKWLNCKNVEQRKWNTFKVVLATITNFTYIQDDVQYNLIEVKVNVLHLTFKWCLYSSLGKLSKTKSLSKCGPIMGQWLIKQFWKCSTTNHGHDTSFTSMINVYFVFLDSFLIVNEMWLFSNHCYGYLRWAIIIIRTIYVLTFSVPSWLSMDFGSSTILTFKSVRWALVTIGLIEVLTLREWDECHMAQL